MAKIKRTRHFKKLLLFFNVVILVAVIIFGLKLTVLKTRQPGAEVGNSGSQNTKGETSLFKTNDQKAVGAGSTAVQPGDQKSDSGSNPAASATLLTPSGNFISNHAPDQAHPTETSVCTTTPGASCSITFTKNDITKTLAAQTTDRGGTTYWNNWTPADVGLTAGSWQIQAVATLDNQTQTAPDAIPLVITQ